MPTIEMHLVQQVQRGPLCKRQSIHWLAKRLLWLSTQPEMHLDMLTTKCRHSDELVSEHCRLRERSDSVYVPIKTYSVYEQPSWWGQKQGIQAMNMRGVVSSQTTPNLPSGCA